MSNLVTRPAPDFTAKAVMPDNSIKSISLSDYKGKYVVLFFYPFDFTFVCPTEIIAFDKKLAEFKERGCEVLACSIDSHHTHRAWKNTEPKDGGIGNVQYPVIADITKDIARSYGVLIQDSMALRGTFLIDQEGVVQHCVINNLPLGRNIDEAIRMLDALKYTEKHGEVCPANWQEGGDTMSETPESVAGYLAKHA